MSKLSVYCGLIINSVVILLLVYPILRKIFFPQVPDFILFIAAVIGFFLIFWGTYRLPRRMHPPRGYR